MSKRIAALEAGGTFDATKAEVQRIQMEHLAQLREIREAMKSQSSGSASSKELEALQAENQKLKETNTKQAYRIQHLCGTVEELLKAEAKQ